MREKEDQVHQVPLSRQDRVSHFTFCCLSRAALNMSVDGVREKADALAICEMAGTCIVPSSSSSLTA